MDVREVGEALVAGCREGREMDNLERLYAEDAVSVEAQAGPDGSRETRGRDAIRGKHQWWEGNFDVHDAQVEGPFPHGDDRFGVIFEMDVTEKASGERTQMKEMAVYHVKGGRIVREEFFYGA